jgi:hypothetical protein
LQGYGIALAYINTSDPLQMAWRGRVLAQEWPPMHGVPQGGGRHGSVFDAFSLLL